MPPVKQQRERGFTSPALNEREPKPRSRGITEIRGPYYNVVGPRYLADVALAQEAMVVNEPDAHVPYTRSIESKWVFPELHAVDGTVVCHEYPGAATKHYPVLDADGNNKRRQRRYLDLLASFDRNPLFAAGRLARYLYINMDEAMRQGLDVAAEVTRFLRR